MGIIENYLVKVNQDEIYLELYLFDTASDRNLLIMKINEYFEKVLDAII